MFPLSNPHSPLPVPHAAVSHTEHPTNLGPPTSPIPDNVGRPLRRDKLHSSTEGRGPYCQPYRPNWAAEAPASPARPGPVARGWSSVEGMRDGNVDGYSEERLPEALRRPGSGKRRESGRDQDERGAEGGGGLSGQGGGWSARREDAGRGGEGEEDRASCELLRVDVGDPR